MKILYFWHLLNYCAVVVEVVVGYNQPITTNQSFTGEGMRVCIVSRASVKYIFFYSARGIELGGVTPTE